MSGFSSASFAQAAFSPQSYDFGFVGGVDTDTPESRTFHVRYQNRSFLPTRYLAYKSKRAEFDTDYAVDWSLWLDGDTIESSSFTVASGLTLAGADAADTSTQILVSGGTTRTAYEVVNTIVTAGGITETFTFYIRVR